MCELTLYKKDDANVDIYDQFNIIYEQSLIMLSFLENIIQNIYNIDKFVIKYIKILIKLFII